MTSSLLLHGAAALGGIGSGVVFARVLRSLAPPALHAAFWRTLPAIARAMATADRGADFLAAYASLGRVFGGYFLRNAGGLLLGLLPLALAGWLLNLVLFLPWDGRSPALASLPPEIAAAAPSAATVAAPAAPRAVTLPGQAAPLALPEGPLRLAFCEGGAGCLALAALGFEIRPPVPGGGLVLLRSGAPAWNPAFPWLNDLEAVFLLGGFAGAAGGFFRRPGAGRP